ncbi:hypothetical protein FXO38_07990 [Capsicum annuum]|nr:hypothetical protein FXO38_07990 [Capsicum annuum]
MSEQSQKKPVSTAYLDSPYFPLPEDMGKNRKELLAMAKGNFTEKKGITGIKSHPASCKSKTKMNLQEFDLEYDNDVEQLLADMESKETETEEERELKLREARAAGCCSSAEVDRYIERKRKREVEGDVPRKESSQIGLLIQESLNMPASSDSLGTHSNRKPCSQIVNPREVSIWSTICCDFWTVLGCDFVFSCSVSFGIKARVIFNTSTMEPEASNAQTMDNNAINLILARLETMSQDGARLNVGLEKLDTDVASMSGRLERVESQRS